MQKFTRTENPTDIIFRELMTDRYRGFSPSTCLNIISKTRQTYAIKIWIVIIFFFMWKFLYIFSIKFFDNQYFSLWTDHDESFIFPNPPKTKNKYLFLKQKEIVWKNNLLHFNRKNLVDQRMEIEVTSSRRCIWLNFTDILKPFDIFVKCTFLK